MLSALAVFIIMLVMWYPQRYAFGLDLGNSLLQSSIFALCMLFRAFSRGGRMRSDPYFEFRSNVWELDAATVRRNVIWIGIEMALLAAILEIGQGLLSRRHGAVGEFLINALAIIAVGSMLYVMVALLLRTSFGRRFLQFFARLD